MAEQLDLTVMRVAERRARLRDAVAGLARAIASGECTPQLVELEALALICDEHACPIEAARVRRWIAGVSACRS